MFFSIDKAQKHVRSVDAVTVVSFLPAVFFERVILSLLKNIPFMFPNNNNSLKLSLVFKIFEAN